jgi:asparagine synthase (glutamine-hydrolysing)
MCGFAGIYAYKNDARPVDENELLRIARGDGVPRTGWRRFSGYRRTGGSGWHPPSAVIDTTETGAQPMSVQVGDLSIVYNGEIYNYMELRKDMEARDTVCHALAIPRCCCTCIGIRDREMCGACGGCSPLR